MMIIIPPADPKSQLDAQRGIGPCSLATRGVGSRGLDPLRGCRGSAPTDSSTNLKIEGALPHILSPAIPKPSRRPSSSLAKNTA